MGIKRSRWNSPAVIRHFRDTSKRFFRCMIASEMSINVIAATVTYFIFSSSLWRIMRESCCCTCNGVRPYITGMKGKHLLYCSVVICCMSPSARGVWAGFNCFLLSVIHLIIRLDTTVHTHSDHTLMMDLTIKVSKLHWLSQGRRSIIHSYMCHTQYHSRHWLNYDKGEHGNLSVTGLLESR